MDRRKFLKSAGSLVAGATLARGALAQGEARGGEGRIVFPFNRNWRYSRKYVEGGHDKGFDDSGFDRVVVPHTNVRLPWHSFDEQEFEFISLYRRRFRLPEEARGRRVFVDFDGVMTASTVWLNGVRLGEYKGGYTPFAFELTPHLDFSGENVLAVDVDSRERPDIPPFGGHVDYLTFGGIYRDVALRVVPETFIENVFAAPKDVMTAKPTVEVECLIENLPASREPLSIEAELRDGERVMARASKSIAAAAAGGDGAGTTAHHVILDNLGEIHLWDVKKTYLYDVEVRLRRAGSVVDRVRRRIGFRQAWFTDHGFELNGKILKLRGLDRHQMFPFVGQAMPGRVQKRDAQILRDQFKCNIVRTSHYPQSPHFLDGCDEVGLLVMEEIPGWQHIGDEAWKEISIDNVGRMVRRDWNHPCVVLWGVRINESHDDHDFYTRTNALAHQLDPTRQTGGVRYFQSSEFLEDVFTMNDFGFPLKPPNHPRYLNTEFVGHTFPTKSIDDKERLTEHTLRHVRVHNQLASNPQYSGGLGWCAFDYNTHAEFGSGDRICYHGVADIFRLPKPAAGFYKSQCEPDEEIVLEPAFHWAAGDESIGFQKAVVCSNCEHLKFYVAGILVGEADADRAEFGNLKYPPFSFDLGKVTKEWGDLRIEGYIGGKLAIAKNMSGKGIDQKFEVLPDDRRLIADGGDTTRVVLRVTDEFGAIRPFANDPIELRLGGPAEIIGDNPFALVGGTGAIWIRAKEQPGTARLRAKHPRLGEQEVSIELEAAPAERV